MTQGISTRSRSHSAKARRRRTAQEAPPLPVAALLTLAAAIFVSMTSEFLPAGLLPGIAVTFGRSLPEVGMLVTIFAASVIAATVPLAAVTRRVDRKLLVLLGMGGVILANALSAGAVSFEMLMLARVVGGAAHGLFWSVAASYAADIVRPDQLARATALTSLGGSLASIMGIPVGNVLGQAFGWRSAFLALVFVGALLLVVVWLTLPAVKRGHTASPVTEPPGEQTQGARDIVVISVTCALILLIVTGQMMFGTYLVPWMTGPAGIDAMVVPGYLLATGAAGLAGVFIVGRFGDSHPAMTVGICGVIVVLATSLYPVLVQGGPGAILVLAVVAAVAFSVVPTMLQAGLMRTVTPERRGLAAAAQTTSFNVAIGGGAMLGGFSISVGGLEQLPWMAAAVMGSGVVVLLSTDRIRRGVRAPVKGAP